MKIGPGTIRENGVQSTLRRKFSTRSGALGPLSSPPSSLTSWASGRTAEASLSYSFTLRTQRIARSSYQGVRGHVQSHTESSREKFRVERERRGAHWATRHWCVSHISPMSFPLTCFFGRKNHIPQVHACAAYLSPPGCALTYRAQSGTLLRWPGLLPICYRRFPLRSKT